MVPKQLKTKDQLEELYETLSKRIQKRSVARFTYAEASDGQLHVTSVGNEITFIAIVESNTVSRLGKISGVISAVALRDNGVRLKLHIYLESGPHLIVELGSRFEIS